MLMSLKTPSQWDGVVADHNGIGDLGSVCLCLGFFVAFCLFACMVGFIAYRVI